MPSEAWYVQGAHFMDKFYLVGKNELWFEKYLQHVIGFLVVK